MSASHLSSSSSSSSSSSQAFWSLHLAWIKRHMEMCVRSEVWCQLSRSKEPSLLHHLCFMTGAARRRSRRYRRQYSRVSAFFRPVHNVPLSSRPPQVGLLRIVMTPPPSPAPHTVLHFMMKFRIEANRHTFQIAYVRTLFLPIPPTHTSFLFPLDPGHRRGHKDVWAGWACGCTTTIAPFVQPLAVRSWLDVPDPPAVQPTAATTAISSASGHSEICEIRADGEEEEEEKAAGKGRMGQVHSDVQGGSGRRGACVSDPRSLSSTGRALAPAAAAAAGRKLLEELTAAELRHQQTSIGRRSGTL
jgi:hypothetical protein